MPSLAAIPARLVALIMEESPEDSPLAGSRASVAFTAAEASTEVEAFMAAEVTGAEVVGDSVPSGKQLTIKQLTIWRTKSCTPRI